MDKVAVLIPCYNEEKTIGKVVKDWKKELPDAMVYVYDNNSTDNTVELAKKAGAIVRYEHSQGKGNVIRRMFREINAECYIMIDGDDTYPAEYGKNMVELVLHKNVDMVIFNRCSSGMDLGSYRRSMKALNSYVQIVFEDKNGDMMSIAEQLPYDVNANVIEVDDCDYGIWYMDVSERPEVYKGKTVRFKGQVLKNKYFKDKNFVPGRKVMTCCAEDTSFIGYISFYDKISSLENRQWITVTAQIAYEFQMAYKKKGPVLYVQKVEPAEAPEDELVYF